MGIAQVRKLDITKKGRKKIDKRKVDIRWCPMFKAVNVWSTRKQILCTTELSNARKQRGIVVDLYAGLSRCLTTLIGKVVLAAT